MRRLGKYAFFSLFGLLVVAAVLCAPRATRFHGHTDHVCCAVFAPDARHFASYGSFDNTVRIWDGATCEQVAVLRHDKDACPTVVFSPDSTSFAMSGEDKVVTIRRASDGSEVRRLVGHEAAVRTIAFGPDGKTVASGSTDGILNVWNVSTGREILSIRTGHEYICTLAYSPDGKLLASSGFPSSERLIQIWDAKTGTERRSVSKPGGVGWIHRLLFSPGSETLCATDSKGFSLWDVATGQERACEQPEWLEADDIYVDLVAFSPDGRTLAVGHDETIGLWDMASGKNVRRFPKDDSDHLLRFSDRLLLLTDQPKLDPRIADVAFRPNGDLMLLGTRWNTVVMWRATSVPLKK